MFNTIILMKGYRYLTMGEWKKFHKGDTIFGNDSNPEELKRWNITDEDEAKKELEKYRCEYVAPEYGGYVGSAEEYALEYCECDEDGEFVEGSDSYLAKEKEMTIDDVYSELEKLVGREFDEDDIICAFGSYEENGETTVIVSEKHTYGEYDMYDAYIDTADSHIFHIRVDYGIIEDIY